MGFNFKLLQFEIKDAKDIEANEIKLGNKSLDAFTNLRASIIKAEQITKNSEVNDAHKMLFQAVDIFNKSTDVNGFNFQGLQRGILQAESLELGLKDTKAFMKLQSAIHKAKQITKDSESRKAFNILIDEIIIYMNLSDVNGINFKILQFDIQSAKNIEIKELELGNKGPEAFALLRESIVNAEQVTKDSEAKSAKKILSHAVNTFNKSTDINGLHFQALQAVIAEANKIRIEDKDDLKTFINLLEEIQKAKKVTKESKALDAKNALEEAMNKFQESKKLQVK